MRRRSSTHGGYHRCSGGGERESRHVPWKRLRLRLPSLLATRGRPRGGQSLSGYSWRFVVIGGGTTAAQPPTDGVAFSVTAVTVGRDHLAARDVRRYFRVRHGGSLGTVGPRISARGRGNRVSGPLRALSERAQLTSTISQKPRPHTSPAELVLFSDWTTLGLGRNPGKINCCPGYHRTNVQLHCRFSGVFRCGFFSVQTSNAETPSNFPSPTPNSFLLSLPKTLPPFFSRIQQRSPASSANCQIGRAHV